MNDQEEWRNALPQLLAGEIEVHNMLLRNVGDRGANHHVHHEFVMTMVKMVRCYGQLDGILTLIEADGNIQSAVTHIAAEISALSKQMGSLTERV